MKDYRVNLTSFQVEKLRKLAEHFALPFDNDGDVSDMIESCVSLAHDMHFDESTKEKIAKEWNNWIRLEGYSSYHYYQKGVRSGLGITIDQSMEKITIRIRERDGECELNHAFELDWVLRELGIKKEKVLWKPTWDSLSFPAIWDMIEKAKREDRVTVKR